MKIKKFVLIAAHFVGIVMHAQNIREIVDLPAPNTASLGIYGEIPISLFTGNANASVPIYTLEEGGYELPIYLAYNGSGVRPDEHPGWVGMNWSLNCGGMVKRVVKGLPDELCIEEDWNKEGENPPHRFLRQGLIFNKERVFGLNAGSDDVLKTLAKTTQKTCDPLYKIDAEPDEFIFNVNGKTGKFYIGPDAEISHINSTAIYLIKNISAKGDPATKISLQLRTDVFHQAVFSRAVDLRKYGLSYKDDNGNQLLYPVQSYFHYANITGVLIITGDGTRYSFGYYDTQKLDDKNALADVSWDFFSKGIMDSRYDAWHLSSIIPCNTPELDNRIDFVYDKPVVDGQLARIASFTHDISYMESDGTGTDGGFWFAPDPSLHYYSGEHKINGRIISTPYLKKIITKNVEIDFSISETSEKKYNYERIASDLGKRTQKDQKSGYYATAFTEENGIFYETPKFDFSVQSRTFMIDSVATCHVEDVYCIERWDIPYDNYSYGFCGNCQPQGYFITKPQIEALDFKRLRWFQLDEISIKERMDTSFRKKFQFRYSENQNQRLRLLALLEMGGNNNEKPPYTFEYENYTNPYTAAGKSHMQSGAFQGELPGYNSAQTDHWGFFNGALETDSSFWDNFQFGDANDMDSGYFNYKQPNDKYLYTGVLNRINYPTGGHTDFIYQPNTYTKQVLRDSSLNWDFSVVDLGSENIGAGLRIWKINNYLGDTNLATTKTYQYHDGILGGEIKYFWQGYELDMIEWDWVFMDGSGARFNSTRFVSNSILPLSSSGIGGGYVGYGKVVEHETNNGRTEYFYSNHQNYQTSPNTYNMDDPYINTINHDAEKVFAPFCDKSFERGLLLEKVVYNKAGYKTWQEVNQYGANPLREKQDAITAIKTTRMPISSAGNLYTVDATAYKIFTYPYNLTNKQTTVYDQFGKNPSNTSVTYTYNNENFMSKEERILSSDLLFTTEYKYPLDFGAGEKTCELITLQEKNIISPVIEKRTYKGVGNQKKVVDARYTKYAQFHGSFLKPAVVYQLNSSTPPDYQDFDISTSNPSDAISDFQGLYIEFGTDTFLETTFTVSNLNNNQNASAKINLNFKMVDNQCYGHFIAELLGPVDKMYISYNIPGNIDPGTGDYIIHFSDSFALPEGDYKMTLGYYRAGTPACDWNGRFGLQLRACGSELVLHEKMKPQMSLDYDKHGNIIQTQKTNNQPIAYFWGYNHAYPVAKAINATAQQLANAASSIYATIEFKGITEPSKDETQLGKLKSFHKHLTTQLPDAQVFVYTFKPLVGMTSMTGPDGIVVFYEYDGFGRLIQTKNHDNKNTEVRNLNYKAQNQLPQPAPGQGGYNWGCSPSQGENYIRTATIRTLDENGNPGQASEQVIYYDGLGRPVQQVAVKASPGLQDVVQPIVYDSLGREKTRYLPYNHPGNGEFRSNQTNASNEIPNQKNFYAGIFPDEASYAETEFDGSPLNRVMKQGYPGNPWQLDQHPTNYAYAHNAEGEAIKWIVQDGKPTQIGTYPENELYVATVMDENWDGTSELHTTKEYKNKLGKVVLKRAYVMHKTDGQAGQPTELSTYYVYDDFSLPKFVIPPEAMQDGALSQEEINGLCYCYKHDCRKRVAVKKLPGADSIYMVYDRRDRPVFAQDGNQRQNKLWHYTRYDVFNRPTETGMYTHTQPSIGRAALQALVDAEEPHAMELGGTYEPLSQTFYDNYNFEHEYPIDGFAGVEEYRNLVVDSEYPEEDATLAHTKSRITGTKTKVLAGDTNTIKKQWLLSAYFYDKYGRPTRIYMDNHLGGYDFTLNKYNFAGEPTKTKHEHTVPGLPARAIGQSFAYDHAGRLLGVKYQLDGRDSATLTANQYNELGQVRAKHVHNSAMQTAFAYNIRGWVTHINQLGNHNPLFAMQLYYENPPTGTPNLNGNISAATWQSNGTVKNYDYTYDALNRITGAAYSEPENPLADFSVAGIQYDLNGNILALDRMGNLPDGTHGPIDQLAYAYQPSTNQLVAVSDAVPPISEAWGDFYDRADSITLRDYAYDANGNTTMDFNASINNPGDIWYNYLNLPEEIRFNDNARRMKNIYDAAGNKLAKILEADDNGKAPLARETLHYVGNFVYRTDTAGEMSLLYILNEEGKITFDSLDNPVYEYFMKDHLGNTRAVVAIGEDGMDTLQTTDFYPFGMILGGREKQPGKEDNKYLFGCKELVNDFGSFAWYDFVGRGNYDKKTGRWHTVDPIVENKYNTTLYGAFFNNPIRVIDPDGKIEYDVVKGSLVFKSNLGGNNMVIYNYRDGDYAGKSMSIHYKENSTATSWNDTPSNYFEKVFSYENAVGWGDFFKSGEWQHYIPIVGSAKRAGEAWNNGNYAMVPVHLALGVAECTGIKATVSGTAGTTTKSMVGQTTRQAATNEISVIGPKATYRQYAKKIGANFLDVADDAWTWAKNEEFLSGIVSRGDDVMIAGEFNPAQLDPNSVLAREINYLIEHGYQWIDDYSKMVIKK